MKNKYDFSGWATKNDLRCSDGRVIFKNAFQHNDGMTVPLVWNHQHNASDNILGHALLENREEGVYAYCKFNETEAGQNAKILVKHGDITSLSIYANNLKQQGNSVIHGNIREVSLVLAGANPGAFIDNVMTHSDEEGCTGVIYTGEQLMHAEESKVESEEEKKDSKKESEEESEETIKDVFDTLTDKQKDVVYAMLGSILENKSEENNEGEKDMKHNIFEGTNNKGQMEELSHSEMQSILADGKRYGSLRESALQHGITEIGYLYPDHKTINSTPDFIARDQEWVSVVMNGVRNTPFSRIKSIHADLRADEARALGYMKGKLKKEEVFTLLKRTTDPQTIYKKQKIDRDDVIDITDFDVVSWLKTEMRMMLNEEIARAILVGDGRLADSDDKIKESNIRPIWKDADLYSIKSLIELTSSTTADERAKAFIRAVLKSRKEYKGSGQPTMFMSEDMLTDCLLMEDKQGRIIYETVEKLATALRVKNIVTVPVMENLSRVDGSKTKNLLGIMVNLNDYTIGADKGGAVNLFDDFDIDYNAQKYLIETRCSGALTKPLSAVVIESTTQE